MKKLREDKVYNRLKLFLYLACGICFVVNSYSTFKKYFDHSTLILTSNQHYDQLPLPVIVLCRHQAYKVHERNLSTTSYINVSFDPMGIINKDNALKCFNVMSYGHDHTTDWISMADMEKEGWNLELVNTAVRGRCLALHTTKKVICYEGTLAKR